MITILIVTDKVIESLSEKLSALFNEALLKMTRKPSPEPIVREYIDNRELCLMLGVTKRTLARYRQIGDLPYRIIGGKVYYRPSDIQKWLEKSSGRKKKSS